MAHILRYGYDEVYAVVKNMHKGKIDINKPDGQNFFLTLWNLNYEFDKAQNKAQNKAQGGALNRESILLILREKPSITQTELAETMNLSRQSVQTIMKALIDEGIIERSGSKKSGTWIVK